MRSPSLNESAPIGRIMNSWNAIGESLCESPLIIFIIGTGMICGHAPPMYLYKGTPRQDAAALATASDTGNIAFAPSDDLSRVPSSSSMMLSICIWL